MTFIKNLASVPLKEQAEFLNSFKYVLSDMDGVIWLYYRPISGAVSCMEHLKKIGKTITFITNNNLTNTETIKSRLVENKFDGNVDIINPVVAMTAHLKHLKFNKLIYAIGTPVFKQELKKAGFSVEPDPPQIIDETLVSIIKNIQDNPDVGAVICDFDFNLTRLKLQKALTYLKRKDCLFLVGGADKALPIGIDLGPAIGNEHFFKLLTEISGREYVQIAKPSDYFIDFVGERLNTEDPKKVLFVGDSIADDMQFAAKAGYQKLLVLTGSTKITDILNWTYSDECKPKYYVDDLGVLSNIIKTVFKI